MATAAKKSPAASKTASKASKTTKPRAKKADAVPPPPPVHVSAYKDGNRVTHPVFGDGKVVSIDRDQLTIQFAKEERVILESFVKLAKG
jgi:hypothetical protein